MTRNGAFLDPKELEILARACVGHANSIGEKTPLRAELAEKIDGLNDSDFDRIEWFNMGALYQRGYFPPPPPSVSVQPAAPAYAHREVEEGSRLTAYVVGATLLMFGLLVGIGLDQLSNWFLARVTHGG